MDLFQSNNMNMKMILRNKLRSIYMSKYNNTTSYFTRITQKWDQLAGIGEKVEDAKLVNVALNGLPKPWEPSTSPTGRGFGMTSSRKRLGRSKFNKQEDEKEM